MVDAPVSLFATLLIFNAACVLGSMPEFYQQGAALQTSQDDGYPLYQTCKYESRDKKKFFKKDCIRTGYISLN